MRGPGTGERSGGVGAGRRARAPRTLAGAGSRAGTWEAPRYRGRSLPVQPSQLLALLLAAPTFGESDPPPRVILLVADERLAGLLASVAALLRGGGAAAPEASVAPDASAAPPTGGLAPVGEGVEPPPDLSELTPRELDVLDLVARGHDNATIAGLLGLSPRTVRNHLNSVFSKLGLAYRPQAVVLAREAGLGSGEPLYAARPGRAKAEG